MDVTIAVHSGGRVDRVIAIGEGDFVIGRDLACHLRIDHERVHHRHCRIRRAGGRVLVEDLNSIDGTLVNDRAIRKAEARDGDRLRVGPTTFVFRIREADEAHRLRGVGRAGDAPGVAGPRVVSDNPLDSNFETPVAQSARQLLARLSGKFDVSELRKELRVLEDHGVAVARPMVESLVADADVRRVGGDLRALIASGRARIALNLGTIERVSGEAAAMLAEVRDECRAAGGLLKLCNVTPATERLLAFLGLEGQFEVAPDERAAVAGDWPGQPAPVAAPAPGPVRVRLVVMLGKARGKVIDVELPKFLIGRDPACHLRPNSPTISRLHAVIERRGGRAFVRDLGGKNGTLLNGRPLSGEEAELSHGDRLQVGPLVFAAALGDRDLALAPQDCGDASGASWIGEAPPEASTMMIPRPTLLEDPPPPQGEPPAPAVAEPPAPIRDLAYEVVGDVLMVKILPADLNDEPEVAPIRYELLVLFERTALPRRVVINLEHVKYLSSRAIGVLLAHFQRLSRAGGNLRLCHVRPEIAMALEQMRVPMLLDIFPTAAEALGAPWE